jgi:hypothetical protein
MTTPLCPPASGTQALVAIDALHTQPRGDRQHRRSGAGRAERRSHALRSEVITPLSRRAWLCTDHDDSTKENRTP